MRTNRARTSRAARTSISARNKCRTASRASSSSSTISKCTRCGHTAPFSSWATQTCVSRSRPNSAPGVTSASMSRAAFTTRPGVRSSSTISWSTCSRHLMVCCFSGPARPWAAAPTAERMPSSSLRCTVRWALHFLRPSSCKYPVLASAASASRHGPTACFSGARMCGPSSMRLCSRIRFFSHRGISRTTIQSSLCLRWTA
mmetsp:Transcript_85856/g.243460  ORF Transcript_85856/g.243460 Transcript_85856/m.243460 type:complete len:201 (-) Transcript_85856:476-1078(-)